MSEGLFLGEEDKFFRQLQGAELRLRGGRDWPNVRKNNNIAAICKNSFMRYVHTSFCLLFPTILPVRHYDPHFKLRNPRHKPVKYQDHPADKRQSGIQTQI